jgi:geranylgeranyl pyrophosphate synthase
MAFQIVDDVLDLTASEDVLGKPVASDLREGKVTMAVIHAVERCTPEERANIETILRDRAFNGVTHMHIMQILQRYGSLTPRLIAPHATPSRHKRLSAHFQTPRSSARSCGPRSL